MGRVKCVAFNVQKNIPLPFCEYCKRFHQVLFDSDVYLSVLWENVQSPVKAMASLKSKFVHEKCIFLKSERLGRSEWKRGRWNCLNSTAFKGFKKGESTSFELDSHRNQNLKSSDPKILAPRNFSNSLTNRQCLLE